MKRCRSTAGFTMIELIVALTLLAFITTLTMNYVNFSSRAVENLSVRLLSDFTNLEAGFSSYSYDKGTDVVDSNANGEYLDEATLVPVYAFVPKISTGFDAGYGVSGFSLRKRTGQAAPNNGFFICARASVSGADATEFLAIKDIASKTAATKFYYNTACPETANMADPAGAATVYTTYWLSRY